MNNDITITSIETITGFGITTGDYKFTLDEPHNCSISQAQDSGEVIGKRGRKLSTLKRNKTVTITGTNGFLSGGLLEMQTGGTFENKVTEVLWTDYLTVGTGGDATTSYTAIGTAGAEIDGLFIRNTNGTLGKELEQASTPAEGKFAYSPTSKKLTFDSDDVTEGDEIVVYYKRYINADTLTNESDKFSEVCCLYIDAFGEDKCNNVYHVQFFIPKADFSGEFDIDMGDDQSLHSFTAEALAGACGGRGELFTFTVFAENEKDATITTP